MPTGYTADVGDGKVTDFATFALRCSRQFGATIMQRDNPMDEPPQLQEPSDYNLKALEKAQARMAELASMSIAEADDEAAKEFGGRVKEREASRARKTETRNRYNAMLAEIEQWTPPTSEHAGLKEFMIQQLRESIKWDCETFDKEPLSRLSGAFWLAEAKLHAARDIAYHAKAHAEEVERTNGRNAWITALYESLRMQPV